MLNQVKEISESIVIRPSLVVLKSLYTGGSTNKTFVLYSDWTEEADGTITPVIESRIFGISSPNSPVSMLEINLSLRKLYIHVTPNDDNDNEAGNLILVVN